MKKYFLIILASLIIGCNGKEERKSAVLSYQFGKAERVNLFDENEAYSFIEKQLSFGPRNPNSEGQLLCLDYILAQLKSYGLSVAVDSFHYNGYEERIKLFNIIGRYKPEIKRRILLAAHWDTRPRAERAKKNKEKPILGANDGASGVALLLETASKIGDMNPSFGIDFVFFDGEDYGLKDDLSNFCLGSKYFAAKNKTKYLFALVFDMVSGKDAEFFKEYNSYASAPDVVDAFWRAADILDAGGFVNGAPIHNVYDDHIPLIQAGIKAVDIIDAELIGGDEPGRDYWHTHRDNMSNIDKETLKQIGDVLFSFLSSIKINITQ